MILSLKMKPFVAALVLVMVIISLHYGESYRVTLICKDEKRSRPPFSCKQPNCEQFCKKLHAEGWGKCQDDNQFVCQCFHICYKDVPAKFGQQADAASSQPSRHL
ncbi:hypothetical protein RHMOL_Rhmol10G0231000 [Rhododendron molle]|uniref:Uncharacterized protein n=1 Tax=Rhododendron molle TaxID=49168 RepID=A0ACC0M510_RHOML|nr:hypothetical protein RHMOL_Rhmol10G0231000 [Rhododendron molle]